jgi:N-acetylmuramoyl-L-alanine amidase
VSALIVIDPGHGRGNSKPGVFDPGAVRRGADSPTGKENTEAEIALRAALDLEQAIASRRDETGLHAMLTRRDHDDSVALKKRLTIARQARADLLVSLHCNADPDPDGPGNPQARGFQVLYRSEKSGRIAERIAAALAAHIPAHGAGLICRNGLYLLRHEPSVLIEMGFIDSDDDWKLLSDPAWRGRAMAAVAGAIAA